jgi:hypothetical protein
MYLWKYYLKLLFVFKQKIIIATATATATATLVQKLLSIQIIL